MQTHLYKDLFLDEGFIEIFHTKKMKYLEAAIIKIKTSGIKLIPEVFYQSCCNLNKYWLIYIH